MRVRFLAFRRAKQEWEGGGEKRRLENIYTKFVIISGILRNLHVNFNTSPVPFQLPLWSRIKIRLVYDMHIVNVEHQSKINECKMMSQMERNECEWKRHIECLFSNRFYLARLCFEANILPYWGQHFTIVRSISY